MKSAGLFREKVARTWARRGRTPRLKRKSRHKAFQSSIGLSLRGRIYKRTFRRRIDGECVIAALEHVRRQVGVGFILVWDRSPPHRSRKVAEYLAAHPEIEVEMAGGLRAGVEPRGVLPRQCQRADAQQRAVEVEEMQQQVERGFNRLRRRPDLLLSFIRHAGLNVKQLF